MAIHEVTTKIYARGKVGQKVATGTSTGSSNFQEFYPWTNLLKQGN